MSSPPNFTFTGDQLANLIWSYYVQGRIFEIVQNFPEHKHEPDPLTEQQALGDFLQSIADQLMNMDVDNNGVTQFDETPFIIDISKLTYSPRLQAGEYVNEASSGMNRSE